MDVSRAIDNVNKQVIETILKINIPRPETYEFQNVIAIIFII